MGEWKRNHGSALAVENVPLAPAIRAARLALKRFDYMSMKGRLAFQRAFAVNAESGRPRLVTSSARLVARNRPLRCLSGEGKIMAVQSSTSVSSFENEGGLYSITTAAHVRAVAKVLRSSWRLTTSTAEAISTAVRSEAGHEQLSGSSNPGSPTVSGSFVITAISRVGITDIALTSDLS